MGNYLRQNDASLKAREDNLDRIVQELRVVTETTKNIESRISGDLWNRQVRWNKKLEIYGDLISAADDLHAAYRKIPFYIDLQDKRDPTKAVRFVKAINSATVKITEAHVRLIKAFYLAQLFAAEECIQELRVYFQECEGPPNDEMTREWAASQAGLAMLLGQSLVRVGKKDLSAETLVGPG